MSRHILVDLDSTTAAQSGGAVNGIGPYPINGAADKKVDRTRSRGQNLYGQASVPELIPEVEDWCLKHIGYRLIVTNRKDFGTIEIWDDRAVRVKPNLESSTIHT